MALAGVFITEFFASVSTRLVAYLGSKVSHALGRENLSKFASTRRFIWVPGNGQFKKPAQGGTNPVKLWDKQLEVDVHIFARNLEDAERLQQIFFQASMESLNLSPFRQCSFVPTGDSHIGKTDIDQSYLLITKLEFGSPKFEADTEEVSGEKEIIDRVKLRVRATKVEFDTVGAVDGDGVFIAPNK